MFAGSGGLAGLLTRRSRRWRRSLCLVQRGGTEVFGIHEQLLLHRGKMKSLERRVTVTLSATDLEPICSTPACQRCVIRERSLEIVSRGLRYGMFVLRKCTGWPDDYVSCVRGGHVTGRGQIRWRDSVPSSVSLHPSSASTRDSPTNSPYRSGRQPRVRTRRP